MRNIIIICAILLIGIAVLAEKYFAELSDKDNNVTKVLSHIPGDAALIINFKNDESFYEIFKDYELFNAIIGKNRTAEISQLRNLLLKNSLQDITADKNIFLSFHPTQDSVEFLFSINLDKHYSTDNLKESVSGIKGISVKSLDNNVYELNSNTLNKPFFLFLQQGVALASFSKKLLYQCINDKTTRLSRRFINEINKASGKNLNSPVNLFVNHNVVSPFMKHFMRGKSNGNSALLNNIKGISSLSMNFKSDALMFNGISNTDTLKPHYLNLFLHQKSAPSQLKKILPENTSNFIAFGLSNVNQFHKDLKVYFEKKGELEKLEEQIKSIKTSTGVNTERDIKPYLDKEFVTLENSYGEKFAIIKATNGRQLNFKLQLISTPYNDQISKLNHSDILYYYFGDPLNGFPKPYYAVVDNYLIVANLPGIITNFLQAYQNELFLSNSESFKQFDQLVANESNILYFVNNKNSKRIIRSTLKPDYAKIFNKEESDLNKFYGLSYQWTSDGDHFFTNLYLSYNSSDSIALNR